MVRTGATFADAAAEYLLYIEHDRNRKPTTLPGYRSIIHAHMLPAFGETALESITTPKIESWISTLDLAASTRTKTLVVMHGIFERARRRWGLPINPWPTSKSHRPQTAAKSPSSHPTKSWPSSAPPRPSRTRRSTSPPPSLGCGAES